MHGGFHEDGKLRSERQSVGRLSDILVLIRLLPYLKKYWLQMSALVALTFAGAGISVLTPWLVKWAIDSLIQTHDLSSLNTVVVAFIGIAAISAAMDFSDFRTLAYVNIRVLYEIRVGIFAHLQSLPTRYFDRQESGEIMSRVQNDAGQLQGSVTLFIDGLYMASTVTGSVIAMFVMSPRLAAITLTVVPVLILFIFVWQRLIVEPFRDSQEAMAKVNSHLQETISGIRTVYSLNREDDSYRRFVILTERLRDKLIVAGRLTAVLMPISEVVSGTGLALVIIFGSSLVRDGSIEAGVLVAFSLYVQSFFDPLQGLTKQYSTLQRAVASARRIVEVLDEQPEVLHTRDATTFPILEGRISFEHVYFEYLPGQPVLHDIDLNVRSGEKIALVGPTGAGKTTMVSLILKLYDVNRGRVTIDGHDVRDLSRKSITSQIGVVLQEPSLFSGTIKENIRYNSEVTDDDVLAAAKAVGAHELIMGMEAGYETPVVERGVTMSLGQQQLISFARALAAKPRIIVLDEATANIDASTEYEIQLALRELLNGRTAFVIAHRLSTVRHADRIVVLDKGRTLQIGSHDELIARGGLYSQLHGYARG